VNVERLTEFLSVLPRGHSFVIEFRDESWYTTQVYELLHRYNVALCIHDWREMPWPKELTADFTYIRFHGSGSRYGGSYPHAYLCEWADRIRSWKGRVAELFIYFTTTTLAGTRSAMRVRFEKCWIVNLRPRHRARHKPPQCHA
jgi:uncharacterized protein YecE (DUF72 family)